MFESVAPLGLERIDDDGFCRCGQFVLDLIEQGQEVFDGADAGENVGVGAPLDQLFELRPGTVQDRGDAQPLLLPQDPGQVGRAAGRRARGEQVEGDGPQREDVRRLGDLAAIRDASGDM